MARYRSRLAENERVRNESGEGEARSCAPVSQICAFTLLLSTAIVRVPNSTPIVDLLSILNPLRTKRESTVARDEGVLVPPSIACIQFLYGQHGADGQGFSGHLRVNQQRGETDDFPTPESPARAS